MFKAMVEFSRWVEFHRSVLLCRQRSREVALRFGENLRRIRRHLGLSQDELAARASLHRTEIGMLENGQRVARITTLIQLAGAMGIDPGELIVGINWGPPARPPFVVSENS